MSVDKLLIIEDSKELCKILSSLFKKEYELIISYSGREGLLLLENEKPSCAIVDYSLPEMDGMEIVSQAKQLDLQTPIIMLTAHGSIERAVEAMSLGAFSYLTKPINTKELKIIVKSAMQRHRLIEENKKLRSELENRYSFDSLMGKSESMQSIFHLIRSLDNTTASVLITGENGTGKHMIARTLHHNSAQKYQPFEMVDASAMSGVLLESELFGHVNGAFPGTRSSQVSRFEKAAGGTLYLSGINAMEPHVQMKILRALQDGFIEPLGSDEHIPIDVRIIASTTQDLAPALKEGSFRNDLYYRLNVVSISIPNLCNRPEDIPLLAEHFLKVFSRKNQKNIARLSTEAINLLLEHDWPGNVRELENALEHAVVMCSDDTIKEHHLPIKERVLSVVRKPHQSLGEALEDPEKHIIITTLKDQSWNRKRTAEVLQITRATLYNKMRKYDIRST